MPDTSLTWFTETTIPDYTNKASDTGLAVMGIAQMLAEHSKLTEQEKQCLLLALERLGDSLTDLSESVESQRYDFDERLRQHLKTVQKGGFRHA